MELNKYTVIRRPVVSSKASKLLKKNKQVTLDVHPHANKQEVAKAIEQLFEVKVDNVRIMVRKGKVKAFRRRTYQKPLKKRAIVTLKKGYSFDKLGPVATNPMPESGENETT